MTLNILCDLEGNCVYQAPFTKSYVELRQVLFKTESIIDHTCRKASGISQLSEQRLTPRLSSVLEIVKI